MKGDKDHNKTQSVKSWAGSETASLSAGVGACPTTTAAFHAAGHLQHFPVPAAPPSARPQLPRTEQALAALLASDARTAAVRHRRQVAPSKRVRGHFVAPSRPSRRPSVPPARRVMELSITGKPFRGSVTLPCVRRGSLAPKDVGRVPRLLAFHLRAPTSAPPLRRARAGRPRPCWTSRAPSKLRPPSRRVG